MRILKTTLKMGDWYRLCWYAEGYECGSQECITVEEMQQSGPFYPITWTILHTIPVRNFPAEQIKNRLVMK